uniref:EG95 n=1 Tax=Echinococcus granulosus TaxID=6210 RepID=D9J238_ECHGR|nr:EG95 [Echinococcus granulosus]ADJ94869.1 EG95 [Echinococcus granulosus]ADJ94870.1 EG95 [Echinococcus granulosus]ADJ94871.1 EG95 [Echinococcus granulosus]
MAFQLCLILFATSVLAQEYKGMGIEARTTETPLRKHFNLTPVGSQGIRLSWEVQHLSDLKGTDISLKAVNPSDPLVYKRQTAKFSDGQLTIGELKPSTLYKMTVEAVKAKKTILGFTVDIETPRAGKKESTVMTSGSALTSAIAGFVFSCIVVALT